MKPSLRLCLGAWSAAWLLAACGGGSDSGSDTSEPVKPTAVARATPDVAALGTLVQLDGSASTTSSGNALNYAWTLLAPANSNAALSSTSAQRPTFTTDAYGSYVADLVVNDGTASSEHARVTISVPNTDPIAVTAPALSVKLGDTITLDGSQSLAPTGSSASALSYQWTLLEAPSGSQSALSGANTPTATLEADTLGEFKGMLVVSHNGKDSEPVYVTINVTSHNMIPIANPGSAYQGVRGQKVQLDGTNSSDADGDALSYRWILTRPLGSKSVLDNATIARPSFVPDVAGNYSVSLIVFDGISRSTSVQTTVTVAKPAEAANQPPVVKLQEQAAYQTERGAYLYFYSDSYDPDGDALTYEWCWVSYPSGYTPASQCLQDKAGRDYIYERSQIDGDYTMQLRVSDGEFTSEAVTQTQHMMLGANRKPTAKAKADLDTVMVNTLAWVDGSSSTDPNGDKMTYAWTLIDRPDNSQATLQQTTGSRISFIPDLAGAYIVDLVVTDSNGAPSNLPERSSIPARVTIMAKTENHEPVVRLNTNWRNDRIVRAGNSNRSSVTGPRDFGGDQPYAIDTVGRVLNFGPIFMANAYDPDGDTLQYLWTLEQPATSKLTSAMTGIGDTAASWTIKPLVAGTYTVTLAVSDGISTNKHNPVSLTAVERENYPSLLLETGGSKTDNWAATWYRQEFFPLQQALFSSANQSYALSGGSVYGHTYRLTAFDRDYTIVDLKAESTDSNVSPWFSGLNNLQTIRKGESVEFMIFRPYIPGESATQAVNGAKVAAYNFTWSFRIAEKNDWRFEVGN